MPRSSRSSARPAPRPAAAPAQQSRQASTYAAPPAAASQHPHPQPPAVASQPQQPGMIAQMAATAGSVAVGSTIGHGLSSMLFGGGSREAAPAPPPEPVVQQQAYAGRCDVQAKDFTKCLDATNDMNSCSYYLEQLKACQAAAAPY